MMTTVAWRPAVRTAQLFLEVCKGLAPCALTRTALLTLVSLCFPPRTFGQSAYVFGFPSPSTAPIDLRVHGVYYRIPRNYITKMQDFSGGDQPLVVMRVTFPGFMPYSPETRQCLTAPIALRPAGCIQVEFSLGPPQPTQAEGYKNLLRLDRPTLNSRGPFGYEVYAIGKAEYTSGVFLKPGSAEGEFVFICNGDPNMLDDPTEGCTGLTKDRSGNAIFFPFPITELSVADQIQQGLITLINHFISTGRAQL